MSPRPSHLRTMWRYYRPGHGTAAQGSVAGSAAEAAAGTRARGGGGGSTYKLGQRARGLHAECLERADPVFGLSCCPGDLLRAGLRQLRVRTHTHCACLSLWQDLPDGETNAPQKRHEAAPDQRGSASHRQDRILLHPLIFESVFQQDAREDASRLRQRLCRRLGAAASLQHVLGGCSRGCL